MLGPPPVFGYTWLSSLSAGHAMPPVRRLTAILAADVAGYSWLMGADEEGTHERLKAHRRELADPKVAEHRGRIVKNTATASWRNVQVLWMPSAAVSKCNEGWLIATRRRPRTSASHSGSGSTSAM